MGTRTIVMVIISVGLSFFLGGCRSSFYHLSKNISKAYNDRADAKYDLQYNHPIRIKIKKGHLIDNYKANRDTITFLQYSNKHDGDVGTVIVLDGKIMFPFSYTNQYGEADKELFSPTFLDAIANWDTTYINSVREENSFHRGTIYIARIVEGKITVLKPRSYDMKLTNQ